MPSYNLLTGQVFNLIKVGGRWELAPGGVITDPVLTFDDLDSDTFLDDGEIGASENDIGASLASGDYAMVISGTSAVFYSSVVIPNPATFDFHAISVQLSNGFSDLVFCFATGTMIETEDGPKDVADLVTGDSVLTKDNGYQDIRWIARSQFSAGQLAVKPDLVPICIKAGALGDDLPRQDLVVSPQHRMLVSNRFSHLMFDEAEVLVPAKALLNDFSITKCDPANGADYFHVMLDNHELLLANGCWSESLSRGAEALKALSPAALEELEQIFPNVDFSKEGDFCRPPLSVREGIALSRMMRPN